MTAYGKYIKQIGKRLLWHVSPMNWRHEKINFISQEQNLQKKKWFTLIGSMLVLYCIRPTQCRFAFIKKLLLNPDSCTSSPNFSLRYLLKEGICLKYSAKFLFTLATPVSSNHLSWWWLITLKISQVFSCDYLTGSHFILPFCFLTRPCCLLNLFAITLQASLFSFFYFLRYIQ